MSRGKGESAMGPGRFITLEGEIGAGKYAASNRGQVLTAAGIPF